MTEVTTPTLAKFLLARIAEREDTARRALEEAPGLEWACERVYDGVYSIDLGPATHPDRDSHEVGEDIRIPREMARHIEANSPARVLADCRVWRLIVEEAERARDAADSVRETFGGDDSTRARVERASYAAAEHAWRTALDILALDYVDHPDFREEWQV